MQPSTHAGQETAQPTRVMESVDAGEPEEVEEATPTEAEETPEAVSTQTTKTPFGDVRYADPGYQDDKVKRYPIDTAAHVRSAWSYVNQEKNASKYSSEDLGRVKARIKAAAKKLGVQITEATEAMVDGARSFDDVRELVRAALAEDERERSGEFYAYCYIADLTDQQVVYSCGSKDELWQRAYTLDEAGQVTLGVPSMVVRTYTPAPAAMQAGEGETAEFGGAPAPATQQRDRIDGRVLEAKGVDEGGGRVFGVRIIAYGDSKNMRRYPEAVMRAAAPLYEGAKAYDHHRSDQEMASGTIQGLIGSYRDVVATDVGLEGDLHLFPGAVHAAEALDAALGQEQGLPPLVGISHDVYATYKSIVVGGRRLQEATAITKVNSSDVVGDPAAGGRAVRMVAGGETPASGSGAAPDSSKEESVPPTLDELLGVLKEATDDQLAGVGLKRHTASNGNGGTPTTEATPPSSVLHALRGGETRANEAIGKDSWLARTLTRDKILAAGLPMTSFDRIVESLPDPMTEADVDARIANIKDGIAVFEGAGLTPRVGGAVVGSESMEKKVEALDNFFQGKFEKGYRSFRQAFVDITGRNPRGFDEDFNRTIMAESVGPFDSGVHAQESLTSSSWNLVLGDSITRRMVAEYGQPSLQTWRNIVSSIAPVNDFRTVRIDRIGGYGTLSAVTQGSNYLALTSPTNEEVTYTPTKRGGLEDLTLEMIANDDVRAISKIPVKLGLAAAQTLYRFVWDFLRANANIYDATALFVAGHNNETAGPVALTQTNLSATRALMRAQTAYGDTSDILSLVPRTLVVPPSLEEIAFQLTKSVVAVPATPAGPSDTPNIHSSMDYIVVDYFPVSGVGLVKWYVVADPNLCPTIEIGFYQGRDTPELFTQADPTQGSVFLSDKVQYKIRHIYSGAVLDFRGFQRVGQLA